MTHIGMSLFFSLALIVCGLFLTKRIRFSITFYLQATPQMHAKRRGFHGRRIRPKSVVDCIEGISADDIPDLLPSLPSTIEGNFLSF